MESKKASNASAARASPMPVVICGLGLSLWSKDGSLSSRLVLSARLAGEHLSELEELPLYLIHAPRPSATIWVEHLLE